MRILGLTRKNTRTRGDISNKWVSMRDPLTDRQDPLRYGVTCLSDEFYKEFFKFNNEIIGAAKQIGIDLGENYRLFFEEGMRVSQQLDGPVRGRCLAKYEQYAKALKEVIITRTPERKRELVNAQLDSLLEMIVQSTASDEDRILPEELVKRLRLINIKIPDIVMLNLDGFVNIIMSKDDYKELQEWLPKVHDELKAKFLAILTVHLLETGKPNWFEGEVDALAGFLKEIGLENAKLYLDYLYRFLRGAEGRHRDFYEFCWGNRSVIEDLNSEQLSMYFKVLRKAQIEGVSLLNCDGIARKAAELRLTHENEEIDAQFGQAFENYKKTGNRHGLLDELKIKGF
ncbi:MAG: hypothetical protein Q7S22_00835 [Candidatus Micrarchaeota archaeon]|nr:hypothetical protein [Candidatus Micrarchaeota archaeon]